MIVSIHQPCYFPWLGLLDKIDQSDEHVVMDEVQLNDAAFQHRNLFLSADGKAKYLSIPFNRKHYLQRKYRELEITDQRWRRDHLNFISNGYRKHPFFGEVFPVIEGFFTREYASLFEAVLTSIRICMDFFDIGTKLVMQSELDYDRSMRRGELVMELLQATGADGYLSGTGAQAYLDEGCFGGSVALHYNRFTHPEYQQRNSGLSFVPGLSCVDVLFNLGINGSRQLLRHRENRDQSFL